MMRKRLGRYVLAVALIGLIRLIPEFLVLRSSHGLMYFQILTMDVALGMATVIAGTGMMSNKGWAAPMAVSAGGALLVSTMVWTGILVSESWSSWKGGFHSLSTDVVLVPRLLFYGITLCFWPYAFWILLHRPAASEGETRVAYPSLRTLWICLIGGAALIGAIIRAVWVSV